MVSFLCLQLTLEKVKSSFSEERNSSKILSGYQQRQVFKWRVNRRFEDRHSPRNVGLLATEPAEAAACPRIPYRIQSPLKL